MALLAALSGTVSDDVPDAVVIGAQRCSREELLAAATAVADRIAGAPVVAVHATACMETLAATVGGLLAGVPVVPLPPDSGPSERNHILTDSGAVTVLGGDGEPVDLTARSDTSYREPPGQATAMILYTSGTTGPPKGVPIRRESIASGLDGLAQAWQWSAEDTLVHGLPLFHVHGLVLGGLGPLRIGGKLRHTVKPTPQAYASAGGTMYFGVPTVWSRVTADESCARQLASARLLVSGSAPLPVPVFQRIATLTGTPPVERYGMTETLITLSTRADGERRPGFVGMPVSDVRTRLVGEDGSEIPRDGESVGELQLRGSTVFAGYLNQPEASAECFTSDGWFRSGDVVTIDAEGWHRIVGRASTDLIKSGGYRIGAGEVENALLAHPSVREAAVVGLPHTDLGQQVVAYVVAGGVSEPELIDFVSQQLSRHKRPREVRFVAEFPRNAMGKVQKKRLPDA